jgi:hypothetical protein
MFLSVIPVEPKRRKVGVLLLLKNKNGKKRFSWKRRLIFFRKHGLSAQNVGIMRRFGFFGKRGRVMSRKRGFLRVQNVNIGGGNIKRMNSSKIPCLVFSSVFFNYIEKFINNC